MDLTPETLRSATFRDKLRGYHPDDVDEFLESVARGLEVLLARLRDATEKARAAAPAVEQRPPNADEAVNTLTLAQRTADLAIHEAKTEAERLVRAAEEKARRTVAAAEESAVQLSERAQAELRADLERLQNAREQLVGEVKALGTWLDGERSRLKRALVEVADRIDTVRHASDAPQTKPVSVPKPPKEKAAQARAATKPAPAPAPGPPAKPAAPAATAQPQSPPAERPKPNAAATPPAPASPAPVTTKSAKATPPPKGEPSVRAPRPAPEPAPAEPAAAAAPAEPKPAITGDAAVLNRAQKGIAAEDDPDPFFAELRAAMLDQSPLGPRDDDEAPQ